MTDISIDPGNLFFYPDVSSREELFRLFHDRLYKKGIVKRGFYKALVEREISCPTGLDMGKYKIAVPHTDTEMVNIPGAAAAVLKKPVLFGEMGSSRREIRVHMVFLMMLGEGKPAFYHNLLNNIKNSDILHKIYNSDNRQDLCLLLTGLLNTF